MDKMGSMKVTLPTIQPDKRPPVVEALLDVLRLVLDRVAELEAANQQLQRIRESGVRESGTNGTSLVQPRIEGGP
jgi:hypothetical protein